MKVLREPLPPATISVQVAPGEDVPVGGSLEARISREARPVPWWLWPHLWSLDAPLVAVLWQRWWARAAGVRLAWPQEAVLALAVWMIYLADRLVDAGGRTFADHGTARHAFYWRRRAIVGPLVIGVGLCLASVTPDWLSEREFGGGLGLLALAGGYFWMIHRWNRRPWTTIFPKEAAVGALFALGSVLFVACRVTHPGPVLALAVLAFAALCFLNCALITRWENSARDRRDPSSLPNVFPGLTRWLGAGCWLLGLASLGFWWTSANAVFLPLAAGAGLLGTLDAQRRRVSADALRVLADVALLAPWCFFPFVR